MGELIIMGIGFDRPTVTMPMTTTKEELREELIKQFLQAHKAELELLPERVGE
jgi:hypothetical protein